MNTKQFSWEESVLSRLNAEDLLFCTTPQLDKVKKQRLWSRILLRHALEKIYTIESDSFEIGLSDKGKPYLTSNHNSFKECPQFNLSHSGDHIFLGISDKCAIGVDVETGLENIERCTFLAKKVLSSEETRVFDHFHTEKEKIWHFNRVWTGKEALLKCTGEGISVDLRSIDVLGLNWKSMEVCEVDFQDDRTNEVFKIRWFQKPFTHCELASCVKVISEY
jgi:4'-phosphopantetheinyl transferase